MAFKENPARFQIIDIAQIDAAPARARQHMDEAALKGLANSIRMKGLIHPVLVHPANADGRYTLIVGERRWRAALLAGEKTLPALIRACEPAEALEIQVFENLGLGMRAALEPRDMANAIRSIANGFATQEEAAEHFGRSPAWLNQATAAANLSPKVTALLDSGKISSTGAAVRLERLALKNEAKAESLIDQTGQLPEGEKLSRKTVDSALSEEGGRRRKKDEAAAAVATAPLPPPANATGTPPWEAAPAIAASSRHQFNPGKVKMVARILGLSDGDEDEILARLIDEFLALKGEGRPADHDELPETR